MSRKMIEATVILCGLALAACQSETAPDDRLDDALSAIEDAMTTKNDTTKNTEAETTSDQPEEKSGLREGTSDDTVPTPYDFPAEYSFGSGKISDYSRDMMMKKLPEPSGNETVFNTAADPDKIWKYGHRVRCLKLSQDQRTITYRRASQQRLFFNHTPEFLFAVSSFSTRTAIARSRGGTRG